MILRVHFNKLTASKGLPWTIHSSKSCIQASHVIFSVPVETEEKPDKKCNPRYFIKCRGRVRFESTVAFIDKE